MRLVTFLDGERNVHAGVLQGETVIELPYPTLLELLRDPDGLQNARAVLHRETYSLLASDGSGNVHHLPSNVTPFPVRLAETHELDEIELLAPVPDPPTVRDFYAFEQHVRAARAQRGLDMIPEWYEIPIFYFTNNSELYGHDQFVPYPVGSKELDFELEIACVIGREGKDIPLEEAADYIAGYTIMNDWSARDFQRADMKLNLGPGKGKDFATSLGPWLVTSDELAEYRSGNAASERYDMPMIARINGREISRANFKDIYYSFPQMIAWASRNARIRAGDVLGSGTVGTGCILELTTKVHRWLRRGDEMELEIAGIGVLRNRVL